MRDLVQAAIRLVNHVSRHEKGGSGLSKLAQGVNEAARRIRPDFARITPRRGRGPGLAICRQRARYGVRRGSTSDHYAKNPVRPTVTRKFQPSGVGFCLPFPISTVGAVDF